MLKVGAETKFSVRGVPRPENFVRDANWTCLLKFGPGKEARHLEEEELLVENVGEEDVGEDEEEDGEVWEQILEESKHLHCQTVSIWWTISGMWILYLFWLFDIVSFFASNPTRR